MDFLLSGDDILNQDSSDDELLSLTPNIYGINFDIFSDEHQSIRNAISKILPDFERWSACIKHREGNVFKYFGADGANAYKGRYTYIFITYIFK